MEFYNDAKFRKKDNWHLNVKNSSFLTLEIQVLRCVSIMETFTNVTFTFQLQG